MKKIKENIAAIYVTQRLFYWWLAGVALLVLRFFYNWLGIIPVVFWIALWCLIIADLLLLFKAGCQITAKRIISDKLSNGDENPILLELQSNFPYSLKADIIDEIPFQFQIRNINFEASLLPNAKANIQYTLKPNKRGEYSFGYTLVYIKSNVHLLKRRFKTAIPQTVPVYPSYLQLRQYRLMAISNRLNEAGVKKIRKFGHSLEFEQIKEYVQGDDYRTINWQATARKSTLMVNTYSDEKSQQVYCVIDKSRVMKMPFDGLSLLDYAINATLVLSNVALMKQDKAGLITVAEKMGTFIKADKKGTQMQLLVEALYNQKTRYLEANYEQLYGTLKLKVTQRSLIILFTNFESLNAMHRQLPYLRKIASQHLLVVVFFENTELKAAMQLPVTTVKTVYEQTIAEQFVYEKKQIVKELNNYGIMSILTPPSALTLNTLNKYLEIKSRNIL